MGPSVANLDQCIHPIAADKCPSWERCGAAAGCSSLLTATQAQTPLYTFTGDAPDDRFGVPDLIVGARNDATLGVVTGSAYVFSGADGALLHHFVGAAAGDSSGRSVSGAGDVNGDGFADLIVGATGDDTGGVNAGSATVFSGFDGEVLGTVYGTTDGGFFGTSVSGAGDVDGDGYAEVIAGASTGNIAVVYSLGD